MIHASLFSGIGGPEVAAKMMGWENAFHCEINPFGRAVLDYWFPESKSYEDITKTSFKEWRGRIDVLTGGFPCQPFSYAGKRGGREDERYLWPEMLRVIDEVRPTWVVGENVAGITTMVEGGVCADLGGEATLFAEGDELHRYELDQSYTIERICKDLEHLGYSVQSVLVPAAAVGAPHRRDRVFIIAHDDVNHPDLGADDRPSGEDEGAEGEERLPERDNLHFVGDSSEVRSEGAGTDTDTICDGCKELGISGIHRGGDFSTRDYAERETQGSTTDPASEMCNGRGAQTGRERQANPDNEEHPVQSAVDGLGEKRTSPHTDCDGQCSPGCGDRCDNRETDCEERECDSLAGTFRPCTSRTVTDSVSGGCQSQEEGGSEPEVRGVIQEQGERGRETKRTDGFPPVPRDASDTECRGSGTLPAPVYTGVADGDEPLRVGCVRTTPDSVREGLEREDESGDCEAGERMCVRGDLAGYDRSRLLPGARWADFPTVSPIHRGNDGIPIRLDNLSIPFSKWRTESLKAYGNAIVPQVMYRIFQAIEFAEANSKTDINF